MATSEDTEKPHHAFDGEPAEEPSSREAGASRQPPPQAQRPEPARRGTEPVISQPARGRDEVLPRRSSDESETGWGDRPAGYDDDWYLSERPPHHG